MPAMLELTVNGQRHSVAVGPTTTLLQVLREKLLISGPKNGCNTGDCGACSVLLDGKLTRSCITPGLVAQGREVTTIEGLAEPGELHPLQRAFHEQYGSQCGFCTPGMILAAKALLDENPRPTEDEIKEAIAGNLCRCTGYVKIVESVMVAAAEMSAERQ